jgi:two-component system KDP operon response regulator KdpE
MKEHASSVVVLFVDDDLFLGQVVVSALREAGYVVHYQSTLAGLKAIVEEVRPDIIFLDVEVDGRNSIDLAPQLKALFSATPLFFISSHIDGKTINSGLNAGGDGYLKKPFDMEEILGYIERYATASDHRFIRVGTLSLDPESYQLSCGDQPIKQLSEKEFRLLRYLAAYPNQLVPKEDIERELWGKDDNVSQFSLNNYITRLRKYLSADSRVELVSVSRRGWKLVC